MTITTDNLQQCLTIKYDAKASRSDENGPDITRVDKVRKLLDLVRTVQADIHMLPVSVGLDEIDWTSQFGWRDYTDKVLERIEMALSELPDSARDAVGFDLDHRKLFDEYIVTASFSPDPLSFDSFSSALAIDRNFFLRYARRSILDSANRYEGLRNVYSRIYQLLDYLEQRNIYPDEIKSLIPVPQILTTTIAFVDNALVLNPDELTFALIGIDLSRLKRCPVCRRAFWRYRKDQKGCTPSCGKVLRTRKWREKTTPEQRKKYKINRVLKEIEKERKRYGSV